MTKLFSHMRSKKGVEPIVLIIATLAGAAVLYLLVWPAIRTAMEGGETFTQCNWSILFSSASKLFSAGTKSIPPECQAKYITVDSGMISRANVLAKQRIEMYGKDKTGFYKEAVITFPAANKPKEEEWSMDYIMGKELLSCWDKVWHGNLDFANRNGFEDKITCVVCSVVSFSNDLPSSIKNKQVNSLFQWTRAESAYGKTYYDGIVEGATIAPTQQALVYNTDPNTQYAIVYYNTKASRMKTWWEESVSKKLGIIWDRTKSGDILNPMDLIKTVPDVMKADLSFAYSATVGGTESDIKAMKIYDYANLGEGGLGCGPIIG